MVQHFNKRCFSIFKYAPLSYVLLAFLFSWSGLSAQQITGVWKGKINRHQVELKIIKNGDSLTGTSYYYQTPNQYSRYSIKGYFDSRDNRVVWWDDQLIEEKKSTGTFSSKADIAYVSRTDFNCPGGTKMYLNGQAANKETQQIKGKVDLQKVPNAIFNDEWNFVIDYYTVGANDPYLIDSIGNIAFQKPSPIIPAPVIKNTAPRVAPAITKPALPTTPVFITEKKVEQPTKTTAPVFITEKSVKLPTKAIAEKPKEIILAMAPLTIKEKFASRKIVLQKEIMLSGDSIELRFYDNAEVDGDSISIFLNHVLLQEHIRLSEKAYTIMLAVSDLQPTNDLVMVAENLGSIPPNTSFMVAMVGGKRYEARLESTANSSAAIRFVK